MTELLTAAQMRTIEAAAIASGEVTGLELMERAGAGVVAAVLEEWPDLARTAHRAVILCGPGNNGGDGFVVARLLKERGWQVEVFLCGDAERLPVDARVNYERWCEIDEVQDLDGLLSRDASSSENDRDLYVDALFGSGLTRPFERLTEVNQWIETSRLTEQGKLPRPLAIVDIPSGICADSGRALGLDAKESWRAAPQDALTVTFHRPFVGHYMAEGANWSGKLVVAPLWSKRTRDRHFGLAINGRTLNLDSSNWGMPLIDIDTWLAGIWLAKRSADYKYTHGHALILAGPATRGGAARLAARGALRIGAGLVTLGAPSEALAENAARLDAVMLREVSGAGDLAALLEDDRINALCLGPGLGADRAADLVPAALAARRPTVLDADALTVLAPHRAPYAEPYAQPYAQPYSALHDKCVLTPHAGEFARLFPDLAEKLSEPATKGPAYSKVDATREAAKRVGCVVLFKGPDTVIADPTGKCSINSAAYDRAAPWLATAGSGDVLAGMIAGLLARGFAPMAAAETAAWLHVEAARSFGPGLIAADLPEELPRVFRALGL